MHVIHARQAVLFQHQDAQAVAGVGHLRGHGIVAGADGVHPDLLQFPEPELLQGVRNGDTHAGMVLVQVHALDFHALPVQEEALVGIEANGADAERGVIGIDGFPVREDLGPEGVQIRVREIPEAGRGEGDAGVRPVIGLGLDRSRGDGGRGDSVPVRIQDGMAEGIDRLGGGAVADCGFQGDRSLGGGHIGMDERPEGGHMHRIGGLQPDVPVDAGTLVEPAFLQGGIDPDGDEVFGPVVQVFGDVIDLRGVAAGLGAQPETVHPDVCAAENAVEAEGDVLPFVLGRDREGLPVPADARLRIPVTDGLVAVAVAGLPCEGKVHRPVVGKRDGLPRGRPLGLVELRAVGALVMDGRGFGEVVEILRPAAEIQGRGRGVSEGELPAVVETDALAGGDGQAKGQGKEEG